MDSGREFWNAPIAMTPAAQQWHKPVNITSPYDNNPLILTLFVYSLNDGPSVIDTLNTLLEAMQVVTVSYEIIVIDDASRDHSAELLRRYIETHPHACIVLRLNKYRKGLAQNYADAAFIGRGKYYRFIPAHNSEPLETMVDILKATGEADIIAPYYIASMQEGMPRQVILRSYTRLLNLATGNHLNNYTGSPIHLRFNIMRWHDNDRLAFQTRLLCRLLDLGFTCKQVPCRTVHRRGITWNDLAALPSILLEIALHRISDRMRKE